MKLVMTRGLTIDTSATAWALANAASVAFLSPIGTSNSTLPGMVRPDLRRALLDRIGNADHGRQRRPVDLDGLDRIAGLIDGVGDHEGNGIADMAHHAVGEDRIGRAGERIDFQVEQARQTAEILDVVGGQDRADARQAAGLVTLMVNFACACGERSTSACIEAAARGRRYSGPCRE